MIGEFPLGAVDEYTIYCIEKKKVHKVSIPLVVLLSPSNFSRPLSLSFTPYTLSIPPQVGHTQQRKQTHAHTHAKH